MRIGNADRFQALALALMCLFLIPGCAGSFTGFPDEPFDSVNQLDRLKFAFEDNALTDYRSATGDAKRQKRNEIIHAQIQAYDIKFEQFEQQLFKLGIGLGVGTDWATLALGALTATVGGSAEKEAFGAISTLIVGGKASVDKHLFMEKTLPVIMAEMVNQRTAVLVDIRQGLQQPVSNYDLFQALTDVRRYKRAGSLTGALTGIAKSAGSELKANEAKISKLITASYQKDTAGDRLREFWKPDGTTNKENEDKLKNWMKQNGLDAGPGAIVLFIRGKEFADLRLKAVKDLIENQ